MIAAGCKQYTVHNVTFPAFAALQHARLPLFLACSKFKDRQRFSVESLRRERSHLWSERFASFAYTLHPDTTVDIDTEQATVTNCSDSSMHSRLRSVFGFTSLSCIKRQSRTLMRSSKLLSNSFTSTRATKGKGASLRAATRRGS